MKRFNAAKTRVLYVDQSAQNLLTFKASLDSQFDVRLASDDECDMDIVHRESIDVVIADNNLPKKSGVQLLQELKSNYPEIGRILITCNKDINVLIDAIQLAGVYRFFVKPYTKSELLQIIKNLKSDRKKWSRDDVLARISST